VQYWNKLGAEGFKVLGADPGLGATNLSDIYSVRKRGALEADVGGERVACVVRGDRDEDVGKGLWRLWCMYRHGEHRDPTSLDQRMSMRHIVVL